MPSNTKMGDRYEKVIAALLPGAERTPRSGAYGQWKGDVVWKGFRLDCKHTLRKSYSVATGIWKKIEDEAMQHLQSPGLVVHIEDQQNVNDLVVISLRDFRELVTERGK